MVAYWRNQKWVQGSLHAGGKWWGTAIVLGKVGRNYVLMHRRQVIRCAPEQVRAATTEEKITLGTPQAELLGIKDMIDQGNIRSQQFLDLVAQSYPPEAGETPMPETDSGQPESDPVRAPDAVEDPGQSVLMELGTRVPHESEVSNQKDNPESSENPEDLVKDKKESLPSPHDSQYGPIRRRITGKDGPFSLWRPAPIQQDEFVEIMKELVSPLVEQAIESTSPAHEEHKRARSEMDSAEAGEPAPSRPRLSEALSVEECSDLSKLMDEAPFEVFMSEYLKKKMKKELRHSNNPPELQAKIDEGKRNEWNTIVNKDNAVRLHFGRRAAQIKKDHADRFIGSRFVLTRKPLEEGGHVDPNDWSSFLVKGEGASSRQRKFELVVITIKAMSTASGTVEWLALLLSEILDGPLLVRDCRLRKDGTMELLIAALHDESGEDLSEFELLSPSSKPQGSMTDASKRRSDEVSSSEAPCLKQRPIAPHAGGKQPDDRFPPGISSLTEWGKTVLQYGKFGKADLTYAEMADDPAKDKSSYCTWIKSQKDRDTLHVQLRDFGKYLAARTDSAESGVICYPGSSLPRQMRG
ncbi:unnamed protein product [Durusdinium trenchii]|uniref:Uncharacterized protein n=1 Tax=Durusdinium trenchii TaxID=1381693 RepID=A0ABP0J7E4_9DINO